MTVLITRPLEDSKLLARLLADENIDSFIEPMFHVKHLSFSKNPILLNKFQGIIFTSRHAVFSLPQLKMEPCFVVGEETAIEAEKKGFQNIVTAKGNLESLLSYIESYYASTQSKLLYLRGLLVKRDLSGVFKQNITIENVVVYETEEISKLSNEVIEKILAQQIKTAVFFSENTVRIFIKRALEVALLDLCSKIHYFVISKGVEKSLKEAGLEKVTVFNGDKKYLVKLLKGYY